MNRAPERLTTAEVERARVDMVERQLRRRGAFDERVLARWNGCRILESASSPSTSGTSPTRTNSPDRKRADDLTALHRRDDLPAARALGERPRPRRRHGLGYQAAVLAELAAEVVTIERVPELAEVAGVTLVDAGYGDVEVRVGDGSVGVPDRAPFDAIAVAAAAPAIPPALYEQLVEEDGSSFHAAGAGANSSSRSRTEAGPLERSVSRAASCRSSAPGFGDS